LPNTTDGTQSATSNDQFATRHDPFVYFHSIIDSPVCHSDVVSMQPFTQDLASEATTPNFNFVVPNLCNTGHDATCAGPNVRGTNVGGLTAADYWLQKYVPQIVGSPAFKHDGLLIVTFDEAGTSDATACCNEQPGLNTALPGLSGPGGGRVGAVLLSPFITPGTTNATPYNHYSMLRSVEDLFGVSHLGLAAASGLTAFGSDVFGGSTPAIPVTPVVAAPPPAAASASPITGTLPATGAVGSRAAAAAALLGGLGLWARRRRKRA
jgi:LPXTG-motif cell wall-anchored protein